MSQRQLPGGGFRYSGSTLQRIVPGAGFSFVSAVGDTTAPTLSAAGAVVTGSTTATGTITTNENNGTLYYLISTNSTEISTTLKASTLTQVVSVAGVQNVSFSGLSPSTVYYAHYLHRDVAGNDSSVLSSSSITTESSADTTSPTLSSATGTQTGSTSAIGTVTTNEAGGTLYYLATVNPSEISSTVKGSTLTQTVSAAGVQNVSFSGLNPSSLYYAHYLHTDAAGNDSTVLSSTGFTTSSSPSILLKIQLMIGA